MVGDAVVAEGEMMGDVFNMVCGASSKCQVERGGKSMDEEDQLKTAKG